MSAAPINPRSPQVEGGIKRENNSSHFEYKQEAVRGLFAAGAVGREIVGRYISGAIGNAEAWNSIVLEIKWLCSKTDPAAGIAVVASLRADLEFAALNSNDPYGSAQALAVLSFVLSPEELGATARPHFHDSRTPVVREMADLVTEVPHFVDALSETDAEAILVEVLAQPDDPLSRARLANVLVRLIPHLSAEGQARTLQSVLVSGSDWRRIEGIIAAGRLGAIGSSALRQLLTSSDAKRILLPQLATAVKNLGADAASLRPGLVALDAEVPQSPALIAALGALPDDDSDVTALVEQQLLSDELETRKAALKSLSERRGFSSGISQKYLATLIEERTGENVMRRIGEAMEVIRPYKGSVTSYAPGFNAFPQFPWPPPKWSFKEKIPNGLVGPPSINLGNVSDRFTKALRTASPDYDYGEFEIPGGFLLLTRLEQIEVDGSRLPGRQGWSADSAPPRSINDYLISLFFSPPGYYRTIAFAVTTEEPISFDESATLREFNEGTKSLPPRISNLPFSSREAYALVYTFERFPGAKMQLNYAGSPSGYSHLVASGFWGALKDPARVQ